MKLYFLRDVKADFAPNGIFKKGSVHDITLNNIPTMLDNKYAVPEDEKPVVKTTLKAKKPKTKAK